MKRPATSLIVVHHSVMPQDMNKVQALNAIYATHKKQGYLAGQGRAAYHVVIGDKWQALTRPEDSVGYHANNFWVNLRSLAVCLMGNFQEDTPTEYQTDKLRDQLNNWKNKYKIKKENIKLHKDFARTACPGNNLTRAFIDELVSEISDSFIKQIYRDIWKREPAYGDWYYFRQRIAQGSILDESEDLIEKMKYTYGKYQVEGDRWWQNEKAKVLGA